MRGMSGDAGGPPQPERRVDVATRLLRQALDDGWLSAEALCAALDVSPRELQQLRAREVVMNAAQRRALAAALEEHVPDGYRVYVRAVRAQALADRAIEGVDGGDAGRGGGTRGRQ